MVEQFHKKKLKKVNPKVMGWGGGERKQWM